MKPTTIQDYATIARAWLEEGVSREDVGARLLWMLANDQAEADRRAEDLRRTLFDIARTGMEAARGADR